MGRTPPQGVTGGEVVPLPFYVLLPSHTTSCFCTLWKPSDLQVREGVALDMTNERGYTAATSATWENQFACLDILVCTEAGGSKGRTEEGGGGRGELRYLLRPFPASLLPQPPAPSLPVRCPGPHSLAPSRPWSFLSLNPDSHMQKAAAVVKQGVGAVLPALRLLSRCP